MPDRFFRDIHVALAERDFHYETFEECVCDLLADLFPGIVPIRGGADSGMDGAIPSSDGPPIPVVVTTAEDVIGNLSRNLERYIEAVEALAAAGVLASRPDGALSVKPEALRAALVRDEILGTPVPLNYRRLLGEAEDISSAVDALTSGVAYGGVMDRGELRSLVRDHGSRRAWQTMAALDVDNAVWAKANYPGSVLEIAGPALHSAPELAVKWLLEGAERHDAGESDVWEILERWVGNAEQSQESAIERRKIVAEQASS